MRRLLALALTSAVLVGSMLVGARPVTAAAPQPTLDVAIPGPFTGCDPGSPTTSSSTDAILSLVLPSTFTVGPLDDQVGDTSVIAQAEVVNLSPQTVMYTLAPDVRWPSGAPFSTADLIRTWQQRRADRVVADLGYRDIASAIPNAAGTSLTVHFATPYADWESLFNLIVPATTHGAACRVPSAADDPSIGPYAVATATATSITLVANPAWTGAALAYPRVVVSADPAVAPAASSAPRVVYLASPTLDQLASITSTGAYTSRLEHSATIASLDFAVRGPRALPIAVRSALAHLVDRTELFNQLLTPIDYTSSPEVSHLLGQGQSGYLGLPGVPVSQATAPVAPVPGASGADAYGAGADPTDADAALLGAGYQSTGRGWRTPTGAAFSVCLAVPRGQAPLDAAAAIVSSQLRRQGITVLVQSTASTTATVAAVRDGTCTAGFISRTGDGFLTHAAAAWLPPASPAPVDLTWTGVDDPIVSSNAAAATQMLNPVEAQPSWNAMDARLWDLMVSLPLYSPSIYEGWSPSIAGVLPSISVAGFIGQLPTLLPTTTS